MVQIYNEKRNEFFKNAEGRIEQFDIATGKTTIATSSREIFMMKSVTDILYQQIDKTLPLLDEGVKNIWEFVKRNFKGMKAIRFEKNLESKINETQLR